MAATGIIDRNKIEDAYRSFNTRFDMMFERASTITSEIATVIDSNSPSETYNWFGGVPKMREWIGDRRFDELRAYVQTIVNKDWSNGIRISANDIRDDKFGLIRPRIDALADEAAYHQEELLINLLISGFTTTGYDSQFFFDTDHVDGDGASQVNKGTAALDATSLDAAILAMQSLKDENGEPIRVNPTTLIVGPKLRATARGLIEAEVLASGATNTQFGLVKYIVTPRLTGTADDYWFLIAGGGAMKPLILQQREPVRFIAQDQLDSEGFFNRKQYRYGADWSGNVGFGMWQYAYGAIVA